MRMTQRWPTRLAWALAGELAACKPAVPAEPANEAIATAPASTLRPAAPGDPVIKGGWSLQISSEGPSLSFATSGRQPVLNLACIAPSPDLLVTLPGVTPIGSEERLSFGGGGDVVALVVKVRGRSGGGGVTSAGDRPPALEAMLRAGPGASYGATAIGPLPPVPANGAHGFAAACPAAAVSPSPVSPVSPCHQQDGKPIAGSMLRAVGTEPFWGADIDGRCVTYSWPERQSGVRLWTRFRQHGATVSYAGSLDGAPFGMNVRPQAGCSDGMSDRRYPLAVTLKIGSETRHGCAAPR